MKKMLYLLATFVPLMVVCSLAQAHPSQDQVLVVIGYIDDAEIHSIASILAHPHYNGLANFIELAIRERLNWLGYKDLGPGDEPEGVVSRRFEWEGSQVTLVNANVDCPGESGNSVNFRTHLCDEQNRQSENIVNFFNLNEARAFSEVIYIGHSRLGLGMGLGPFFPQYTVLPQIFNSVEKGRLQRVVFASCQSEHYYGPVFRHVGIDFAGLDTDGSFLGDDLTAVLSELNRFKQGVDSLKR